jgi:ATP-NAD kinase
MQGGQPQEILKVQALELKLLALRLADRQAVPVLGVNLGKLGFLAEVDVPDLTGALSAIDEQEFPRRPGGHRVQRRRPGPLSRARDRGGRDAGRRAPVRQLRRTRPTTRPGALDPGQPGAGHPAPSGRQIEGVVPPEQRPDNGSYLCARTVLVSPG